MQTSRPRTPSHATAALSGGHAPHPAAQAEFKAPHPATARLTAIGASTWSSAPAACWSSTPSSTRGRLQLDPNGLLWHGRHLLTMTLRAARWEADQADEVLGVADVQIAAIVAVHGATVPWDRLRVDGVTVASARRVPDLLRALPPILGPERVAWLADRARLRFRPAG
jgi:hypothetical protein